MANSSKSVTVGYKYYVGMHMVLTHGPVDKLLRVQVDERTAWQGEQSGSAQISINNADLFGGESREGGISGLMDFEVGSSTQTPNSYLVSKLGAYVPGFRGVAGVVLRQMYMGLNPYLKKWSFRLSRIHTRQKGVAQWYDAKAEIKFNDTISTQLGPTTGDWRYKQIALDDNSDYSSPSYDDSAWSIGTMPFASSPGHPYAAANGFPATMGTYWALDSTIWLRKKFTVRTNSQIGLEIFIDNFADVWLNGVKLVDSVNTTQSKVSFVIPASLLIVGENTIVMRGRDDGMGGSGDYAYAALKLAQIDLPQYDMNPAHIIRECLTDSDWGMGYQDADIDDASFIAAADRLYDEEMGMSLVWDTQTSIEEFIKVVVKHIDAALYVERTTGKFVLKLIRNDYDVNTLITLDESNVDKISDFTRPSFGELTNSVTVTYWDAQTGEDSTLTVQDIALAQMQQCTINTSVQYNGFTNSTIASRVAQRDLKTLSTPLATCTVYANRDAASLNIGKCFKLTWQDYEISELVMRVTGIAYGDGKSNRVRLQCVQDIFALPDNAFIQPPGQAWSDPTHLPLPATVRKVFEIPYLELVQTVGQSYVDSTLAATPEVGYVGAAAVRTAGAINSRMFDDLGSGYVEIGNLDFSPGATLDGDINETATTFAIKDGFDLDQVQLNTWVELDSEIMAVTAISATSIRVKRGCLDTTPKKHLSGAYLVFWDNYAQGDDTELVSSEIAKVKICTVTGGGQLTLAEAPEDTVTIVGRAARPYPPANVKVNTAYFPAFIKGADLALTWVHRDRKQQTASLVGFTEASIGPEAGTTYTLKLYGETNALQKTHTGISGTSRTWDSEAIDCGLFVQGDPIYHIEGFNSQIPVNYATWRYEISNTTTATFDASTGAVFLDNPTSQQAFWDISSLSNMFDIDLEMDFELISDTFGQQHLGFWLNTGVGSPNGYRIARQTGVTPQYGVSVATNGNFNPSVLTAPTLQSNPNFAINARNRLRVVWSAATGLFSLYCNGVKIFDTTIVDFTYRSLRPGIFLYGCKIRVHEIICNGHSVLNRLNNQVTMNLAAVRDSLSSYQPFEFKTTRVGYGYSYGLSYGGL